MVLGSGRERAATQSGGNGVLWHGPQSDLMLKPPAP